MNASLNALLYMESQTARNGIRRLLRSRDRLLLWSVTAIAIAAACVLYCFESQETQPLVSVWLGPTGIAVLLVFVGLTGMIGLGDQLHEAVVTSQLLAWATIAEREVTLVVGLRIALQAWSTLLFRSAPFALLLLPKGPLVAVALRWYLFAALAALLASGARLARTVAPRLVSSLIVLIGAVFVVTGFAIVAGVGGVEPAARFTADAVTQGAPWPFVLVCAAIAGVVIVSLVVAPVKQARLGADAVSREAAFSPAGPPTALAHCSGPMSELWMISIESARNGTHKAVLLSTAAAAIFGTLGGVAARNLSGQFIALLVLGAAIGIVVFAVAISHAAAGSPRAPIWWCLGATRQRIILRMAVRGAAQALIAIAACAPFAFALAGPAAGITTAIVSLVLSLLGTSIGSAVNAKFPARSDLGGAGLLLRLTVVFTAIVCIGMIAFVALQTFGNAGALVAGLIALVTICCATWVYSSQLLSNPLPAEN